MFMRFTQDHGGHRAGDVVEVSPTYAANLLEQGVAVDASTPVVERAVAVEPEKRTATVKR
jgi:ribosomal protein L9